MSNPTTNQITANEEPWLAEVESRHNLFPNIDYRVFSSVNYQYGGN